MNNLKDCVFDYFFELKRTVNQERKNKITYLCESINNFLADENVSTAYEVYSTFFDIYKLTDDNGKSFIDLLDVLHAYEENAAIMNERQRDHYIHSVNVFVLGLSIFAKNKAFAKVVHNKFVSEKTNYVFGEEEFLLRWGIASLFHDIGYPIEIINNQLKGFISFVSGNDSIVKIIAPYIEYVDFSKFNSLEVGTKAFEFCPDNITSAGLVDVSVPTDIISAKIAIDYGFSYNEIKNGIDGYVKKMQKFLFVDHGFYSSVIIMKWYAELTKQQVDRNDAYKLLYYSVADAATAILLHNYYEKTLLPFYNKKMNPHNNPIAYLLALCDCAQEWNRKAYGYFDKKKVAVDSSDVDVTKHGIKFHYITEKGTLNSEFVKKKSDNFISLLELDEIFPDGITVTATTNSSKYISYIQKQNYSPTARPLIENIEKIAMAIHEDYVKKQIERGKKVDYATWDELPDSLKYSNIRQAKTIFAKLSIVGCSVEPNDSTPIKGFSNEEIELMAEYEHELWVEERKKNGWTYGEVKDVEKQITPYLIPYNELTEEIKEYDRDTIRNIIPLLKMVGMAVYRS